MFEHNETMKYHATIIQKLWIIPKKKIITAEKTINV